MVTDVHSILARWRNHFSQLLNVPRVKDVRQSEIRTAEPLLPVTSPFEVEVAIEKLKRRTSPGIDQIPSELINARGRTIRSQIHKLINSIWSKKEMPEEWKELITYMFKRMAIKQIILTTQAYNFVNHVQNLFKLLLSKLVPYVEEIIGDQHCGY
jgi:hypothetical protein